MKINDKTLKILNILCVAVIVCFALSLILLYDFNDVAFAMASDSKYSDVLEDLEKDRSFNIADYPNIEYSKQIDVIQIAESDNKELFVYTYQPGNFELNLSLSFISIKPAKSGMDYKLYDLSLVSKNGVFNKYLVKNLSVSNDALRYYDISEVFRPFDANIDNKSENDNIKNHVPYFVGQRWEVWTVGDTVSYSYVASDTIEIKNIYVDFLRFSDGFDLVYPRVEGKTDAHYIAFSMPFSIDSLMSARVTWIQRSAYTDYDSISQDNSVHYGEYSDRQYKNISVSESGSNSADGLWGKKFIWQRIQKATDFVNSQKLTDVAKNQLVDKQWVLLFLETEWKEYSYSVAGPGVSYNHFKTEWTDVSEETILALTYEVAGKPYTVGVVANIQTGDSYPGNTNTNERDPLQPLRDLLEKIIEFFEKYGKIFLTILCVFFGLAIVILAVWLLTNIVGIFKSNKTKVNVVVPAGEPPNNRKGQGEKRNKGSSGGSKKKSGSSKKTKKPQAKPKAKNKLKKLVSNFKKRKNKTAGKTVKG